MAPAANGAAEARKRRKEIIQSQRGDSEVAPVKGDEEQPVEAAAAASKPEKKPPKKRKIDESKEKEKETERDIDSETDDSSKRKTQIRYDPEVPMDKDQLAAWRREARRVRNRESAAASRQRIRNRINELEDEVGEWKTKYSQAMERLATLQQSITNDNDPTSKT